MLTGTQLGSYGFELPGMTLSRVVERILTETGVVRLRVSSLQPQELNDDLLSLWSDRRLCPHFHIPLQSGSDTVLRRMRRRYTARLYAEAVETIRRRIPEVSITTDLIVGFPGETDDEFEETYHFCEQLGFSTAHVFPYSIRPGTSAAHFSLQVPADAKSDRAQRLLKLTGSQAKEFRSRFIGGVRPVLWKVPG